MVKQREKYISKLNSKERKKLISTVNQIVSNELLNLDIRKVRWEDNIYRCRVWKLRILFKYDWKN